MRAAFDRRPVPSLSHTVPSLPVHVAPRQVVDWASAWGGPLRSSPLLLCIRTTHLGFHYVGALLLDQALDVADEFRYSLSGVFDVHMLPGLPVAD